MITVESLAILVAAIAARGAWPAAAVTLKPKSTEYVVPVPGSTLVPASFGITFATKGPSAFRVSLRPLGASQAPIDSPMVQPDEPDAPFTQVKDAMGAGISAAFGSVKLLQDGRIQLAGPSGTTVTESLPLKETLYSSGTSFQWKGGHLYGRGGRVDSTAWTLTEQGLQGKPVVPLVENRGTYTPYYFCLDGYGAMGVTNENALGGEDGGPHGTEPWAKSLTNYSYDTQRSQLHWSHPTAFDLYLMPAVSLEQGTQALYALTGAPRVLPRYAFGFIASRWGWQGKSDIDGTLAAFRQGGYPLDAIISDFEFFTTANDYDFKENGRYGYDDFGYNLATLPTPKAQFESLRQSGVRMGAIRKPRLGSAENLQFARSKKWLMNVSSYANRYLDFTKKDVQDWYGSQNAHYIKDGLSFWWNDEGEASYFTYYWWNQAEKHMLETYSPSKRFFSLNRAFTPGMARMGAAVWTGDTEHSWSHLAQTPGMVLNWGLAGAPYVACDIGGFFSDPQHENPHLLVRWYQVGAFMPIMRVHSAFWATPRFPVLEKWGPEARSAMKEAMHLRYRLLPYHYSLAHAMFRDRELWMRPLIMDFPHDETLTDMTWQWLDGPSLLVAPVLSENSQRNVYLPEGRWYRLNSSEVVKGPQLLTGFASLYEVPVYAKEGTVLPLAPQLMNTDELPGGPLEVQVYAGADGHFDLVEDDGETTAYEEGARAMGGTRRTSFVWDDSAQVLHWAVEAPRLPLAKAFQRVFVTYHHPELGTTRSRELPLEGSGSISLVQLAR